MSAQLKNTSSDEKYLSEIIEILKSRIKNYSLNIKKNDLYYNAGQPKEWFNTLQKLVLNLHSEDCEIQEIILKIYSDAINNGYIVNLDKWVGLIDIVKEKQLKELFVKIGKNKGSSKITKCLIINNLILDKEWYKKNKEVFNNEDVYNSINEALIDTKNDLFNDKLRQINKIAKEFKLTGLEINTLKKASPNYMDCFNIKYDEFKSAKSADEKKIFYLMFKRHYLLLQRKTIKNYARH